MKLEDFTVGGYVLGSFLDWTYWVARGIRPENMDELVSHWYGGFLGIFIAPFWPLHILIEAWFWVLG